MALRKVESSTLDEYIKLRENSKELYEYINGEIIRMWSPSTAHQNVVFNLGIKLKEYFKKKKCAVMISPYDVFLSNDEIKEVQVVIPDISVMCKQEGFDEKRYKGVPTIIVEVLSNNIQDDTIRKFNVYLKYGVKEYWIINPKDCSFQVHTYDMINETYVSSLQEPYTVLKSKLFKDLSIDMNDIFE
ncbi:MAG: Uma2 family endonuclease [Clostridium butyricum]|nr:Uma2 family endonuclease [Clostridium butyricum]